MFNLKGTRRDFMKKAGLGAAALGITGKEALAKAKPAVVQGVVPRWRGFNLLNFFTANNDMEPPEDDFRWIADWGFDFVRMPMSYLLWIEGDYRNNTTIDLKNVYEIKESSLEKVDRVIELGDKYGIHVSLNFHRAPGYCINPGWEEPFDLWKDQEAQDAFCYHWEIMAKRYKGIPPSKISYNLVNEAPRPSDDGMTSDDYKRVMTAATQKIRAVDPNNLVIVDGYAAGNIVVDELIDQNVVQSVHGYGPGYISHYQASWSGYRDATVPPVWPDLEIRGEIWDRLRLEKHYAPWGKLIQKGIGVHMGECGGYNKTPHGPFLAWMQDVFDIITSWGIGYSLWNFRGSFGIMDSGRTDVDYENWYDHKLDRKLLTLLQEH